MSIIITLGPVSFGLENFVLFIETPRFDAWVGRRTGFLSHYIPRD